MSTLSEVFETAPAVSARTAYGVSLITKPTTLKTISRKPSISALTGAIVSGLRSATMERATATATVAMMIGITLFSEMSDTMLDGKNPRNTWVNDSLNSSRVVVGTPWVSRSAPLPTPSWSASPSVSRIASRFRVSNQKIEAPPMRFSWEVEPSEVMLDRMETITSGATTAISSLMYA